MGDWGESVAPGEKADPFQAFQEEIEDLVPVLS